MTKDPFTQTRVKVPAFEPWITDDDKRAVLKSLNSTMLTLGPNLEKFELMFSRYTKSKYAVGVSNATAALHLSLKSLGIGKGDEVIVPDFTFIADINAVIHTGATPVLADIHENGFLISLKSIKEKITKRTKAIIPVHMYGESCQIKEIVDVAKSDNIYVIEDCAHAIGTYYEGTHVGNFGLMGCFSFYPTKNLTTAEGGMIITNSKTIADKLRILRNHGMTKTLSQRYTSGFPWVFDVKEPGYNYRMDELRASLGISQLKRINKMNSMRKQAAVFYTEKLKDLDMVITPQMSADSSHSYHLYHIRVKKQRGKSRNELFRYLGKKGIRTTLYYLPLHEFSAYKKFVRKGERFPNSSKAYEEVLALPLYPTISRKQQQYVVNCIKNFVKNK